jgi:hypothetical protein
MLNGLQLGSVYALIALGYTMVYGILRLINFAHGDIFMISCYFGFFAACAFLSNSTLDYGSPLELKSEVMRYLRPQSHAGRSWLVTYVKECIAHSFDRSRRKVRRVSGQDLGHAC